MVCLVSLLAAGLSEKNQKKQISVAINMAGIDHDQFTFLLG